MTTLRLSIVEGGFVRQMQMEMNAGPSVFINQEMKVESDILLMYRNFNASLMGIVMLFTQIMRVRLTLIFNPYIKKHSVPEWHQWQWVQTV